MRFYLAVSLFTEAELAFNVVLDSDLRAADGCEDRAAIRRAD